MTNYATGHLAEKYAVEHLEKLGYKILDTNWKTRWCEIDIIAEHKKRVYFIEVKHRKNTFQGSGLEYITGKKLRQMTFAARMWTTDNNWGGDYSIGAIELGGPDYEITNFLPEI